MRKVVVCVCLALRILQDVPFCIFRLLLGFEFLRHHSCEVWCPSGSDDDCPDGQLCFAFSQCHAVDMNATTLEQQKEVQAAVSENGGGVAGIGNTTQGDVGSSTSDAGGVPAPETMVPTKKPSLTAEEAMHRHSFCGKFWVDVSGVMLT